MKPASRSFPGRAVGGLPWPLAGTLALPMVMALAACSSAPVYEPPAMPVPAAFGEAAAWQGANPQSPDVPDDWWRGLGDPVLTGLQARVVVDNENLKASAAQLRAAEAALAASRASLWPTVGVSTSATRSRNAATTTAAGGTGVLQNTYSLSGSASWDADLWGRLSGAVDASSARLQASRDDLLAARLSIQVTLAQVYFSLRTAEAQGGALERAVAGYQKSLELTQNRYAAGVASAADVAQAQSQLQSAQAQSLELRTQRAQLAHAIAVLLGQPPASFRLAATAALPVPPEVPALLPATLLQRRPDIAAAERRVAAANAQVGVARAAFFPALTLSASGGYRGNVWADLVSLPNRFWSFGPALAFAVFDGGGRSAATNQALAAVDQAAATYRQTVLTAFQEVEDNLVAAANLREEAQIQAAALAAARRSLEITLNQYRYGTVSYLNVVTAQATALTAERTLIDVQNRQLAAVAQLLKNAAGRWDRPVELESRQANP